MKIDEAILYLTHTSKDDFNLEDWQQENRYQAIQVVLKEIERLKFIIQCLLELKLEDEDYDKIYKEHKNLKEIGAIQWEIKKR